MKSTPLKRALEAIRSLGFSTATLPLAIVLLLAAAFGWFVPSLGFYWDDWAFILTGKMQGLGAFWQYHQYDRPLSAWINVVQFPWVGTNPAAWQVFALGLRGLTAILAGWTVRLLWPQRARQAAWTALLFAVYPVFTQQPIAVTYTQHWTCYILYMLSLALMILAFRNPRRHWLYTGLAAGAMGLNLFSMEYFAGMEFLRPVILWFLLSARLSPKETARQVISRWWPYLVVLAAFVIWRVFFLRLPSDDPNQLRLAQEFAAEPVSGLRTLWQFAWQDTLYILFTGWTPSAFTNVRALAVAGATALLTVGYLSKLKITSGDGEAGSRSWAMRAMLLGFLSVILAPSPAWLIGKQVVVGAYSSRFALPALFGASLLAVALLTMLFSKQSIKLAVFGVLIALAVLFHHDNAARYLVSWEQQRSFYWQMFWRAPSIQPNTPILSDGEVLNLVGFYSTTAGLNLLYGEGRDPADLEYWFFNLENKHDASTKALESKRPFSPAFRNWRFAGRVQDSLVIENSGNTCVRIVEDGRPENELLSSLLRGLAPASNLDRIQLDEGAAPPPEDVFGPEPVHTWCYYYQKAELARQFSQWDEIIRLGDEARGQGFAPTEPAEWFPFIEGYALGGDPVQAEALTRELRAADSTYDSLLCSLWDGIVRRNSENRELVELQTRVGALLACPVK